MRGLKFCVVMYLFIHPFSPSTRDFFFPGAGFPWCTHMIESGSVSMACPSQNRHTTFRPITFSSVPVSLGAGAEGGRERERMRTPRV